MARSRVTASAFDVREYAVPSSRRCLDRPLAAEATRSKVFGRTNSEAQRRCDRAPVSITAGTQASGAI